MDDTLNIDWYIPFGEAILPDKNLRYLKLSDSYIDFDYNENLYKCGCNR